MLIANRSLPCLWAVKAALLAIVLSAISACGDKRNDTSAGSQQHIAEKVDESPQDEIAITLIEDGFYQEQEAPNELLKSDSDDQASNPSAGDNTPSEPVVEGLGFSEAEQDQYSVNRGDIPEPFCLNKHMEDPKNVSIESACEKISNRLASVKYSACIAAKLKHTGCSSVNDFPILMREFPPLEKRKPQGRILIIGGTHGDELTSVSVTLRWIEKLNKHHSGLFHWHMVPMMNPDGVLKRAATRTNGNGVDLNRNMPSDDWERNAIKYWTEKSGKNPRRYPGKEASSEPETRWLIDEINDFKPDAIISVHAPYGVVDFDSLLLNTAPKSLGKLRLNLLGTYPGSLGNYAGINRNIPVITLELPHSWVMPSHKESTKIWEDIVSWLKKNVKNEFVQN